ncbi:putative ABC transport system permease protein [Catenulispora sp. GP43]|uniref:FtsX-like permease family protein n=1 Tax=Catenulispora sp. GP43 TaxID=3156263 RepID=UPI003518D016
MSSWGLALRVARREAWRNKKRSALVVAMLALPVAGASAADTLWHSSQITAEQKAVWQMGSYDALLTDVGTPMYQTPDLSGAGPAKDAAGHSVAPLRTTPATVADLSALLPAGSHVARPEAQYAGQVQIVDSAGRAWGQVMDTDLADPKLAGTADRIAGSPPASADEVALSSALAGQLHKGVGDTIALRSTDPVVGDAPPQSKTVRVTGVYDSKLTPYDPIVFDYPGAFAPQQGPSGQAVFPIAVPGGVDWSLTQRLNAQGFTVQSKHLLADPPPASQVPYYGAYPATGGGSSSQSSTLAVAAIALSMVLLEVVLLAGPAFAVSARRRRRDFGLLGAAGADSRRLRRIVLADGIVLGAVGGVVGTVAGIGGAAAVLPWFGHHTQQALGGFRLRPLELAAAAVLGVGTGVAAAVAPAIATARQDVMVALTGRRGQSAMPWKLPLIGLAGVVLGSALILVGAFRGGNPIPVAAGVAFAELGLVACTPILVAWSGKLARLLPLTGRLALRDGARNRGRTAPAVAAIMAAVAGATGVAMVINSDDAQQRHYYQSQLRLGQAVASLGDGTTNLAPAAADRLVQQIEAVLPTKQAAVMQGVGFGDGQTQPVAPTVLRTPENACPPEQDSVVHDGDPRCSGMGGGVLQFLTGSSTVVSGGPELVRALVGRQDAAAEAVLKAGGAVVFDKYDLATTGPNPTVQLRVGRDCTQQSCPGSFVTATLPAAFVDSPRWDVTAVVAPGTLDKYGVNFIPMTVLFDTSRMPSAEQEQRADNLVGAAGIEQRFYVERGYQSQTRAGLLALAAVAGVVMLGAAAVATGLAITDAQADLETLAAIGARPRVRRLLAGSQAAVTAGLGAVLGTAFGLLPAVGLIEAKAQHIAAEPGNTLAAEHVFLAPPWLYLGAVVVALPVLAAAGSAGFVRSRIEMRRRRG